MGGAARRGAGCSTSELARLAHRSAARGSRAPHAALGARSVASQHHGTNSTSTATLLPHYIISPIRTTLASKLTTTCNRKIKVRAKNDCR